MVSKLKSLRIPIPTLNWIINFLTNRKQRVKLASDCLSEWGNVPAEVPQGTKLGPWLFVLMINDLRPDGVDQAKFVDDLTISETVLKSGVSIIQNSVNSIKEWSDNNSFRLHDGKCKELRIDFKQNRSIFSPISINDKQIEVVNEVKLLGVTLRSDLRWNSHVHNIISKCSKRLYLLIQLKRANVAKRDILQFYTSCIRSVLEYAAIIFHHSIPKYLSEDIERMQRRALSIIYPDLNYKDALTEFGEITLYERRERASQKFFQRILDDPCHKLYNLISKVDPASSYNFRHKRLINIPHFKTERFKNTFLVASSLKASN